jgi:hypothetical protein
LQTVQLNQQSTSGKVDDLSKALQGWWDNTTVNGVIFYDLTDQENFACAAPSKTSACPSDVKAGNNGASFDIKRFYITIAHKFDDNWSASITTDANYQSSLGQTSLFIKKAFVQWTVDPSDPWVNVRVGSADTPWIPYVESVYGYRFVENVLVDRIKFGNSADWGVHVFGSLWDNLLSYQVSAVAGAGYKKAIRTKQPDIEGRISLNWMGLQAGVGILNGVEGLLDSAAEHHHYTRFDALAAYTIPLLDGLKVGVEYFDAMHHGEESSVFNGTTVYSENAYGFSPFANFQICPEWSVFGRYDYVRPEPTGAGSLALAKNFHNDYYNGGVDYKPIPALDFALVYKRDSGDNGFFADQNSTIGGSTFALGNHGTYQEIGLWGQVKW